MNLKKNRKVFTSKFVGTGPSSYEKRIYRAAVSQRLRNTGLDNGSRFVAWQGQECFSISVASRMARRPTRLHVKWVAGISFPVRKWRALDAHRPHPCGPDDMNAFMAQRVCTFTRRQGCKRCLELDIYLCPRNT